MERYRICLAWCVRGRSLKSAAVLALLAAALTITSIGSALPSRFDMGVYDPVANQAGGGREYTTLSAAIAMSKTAQANARFVRIPMNWDRVVCSARTFACTQAHKPVDPTDPNDPAYEWHRGPNGSWYHYEEEIRAAFANDLEPVIVVSGVPAFAECNGTGRRAAGVTRNGQVQTGILSCTDRPDEGNFRPDPSDFGDFVTALSRKFSAVRYFQVWNEPNYAKFLKPARKRETVTRYRALVNAAHQAIKSLDSDDQVVAGGTAPNPRTAPVDAIGPKQFLRQLVSKPVRFDAYSTHPYTPGGPRTAAPRSTGSVWLGNLGELRSILQRAKAKGTVRGGSRFWVTEFSWDSAPPDCRRGIIVRDGQRYLLRAVPAKLLVRWVSETAYEMWQQGVSVLIWAQLKDYPADRSANQGGLYRWGGNEQIGRAKGAIRSFRFPFVAYKRNGSAYVWGRLPSASPGDVVIERRVGSQWRKVARVRTFSGGGLFRKRLHADLHHSRVLRARAAGEHSAAFALKAPSVPRGIQPFGCTNMSQWQ